MGSQRVRWSDVFVHWKLVVADLAQVYGVHLHDPQVLQRPWPWTQNLIEGLLSCDSRVSRVLAPQKN